MTTAVCWPRSPMHHNIGHAQAKTAALQVSRRTLMCWLQEPTGVQLTHCSQLRLSCRAEVLHDIMLTAGRSLSNSACQASLAPAMESHHLLCLGQWPCAQADRLLSRALGLRRLDMRFYSAQTTVEPILLLHMGGLITCTHGRAPDNATLLPCALIQNEAWTKCSIIQVRLHGAGACHSHKLASAGLQFLPCLERLSLELTGCRSGSLLHCMLEVHEHAS